MINTPFGQPIHQHQHHMHFIRMKIREKSKNKWPLIATTRLNYITMAILNVNKHQTLFEDMLYVLYLEHRASNQLVCVAVSMCGMQNPCSHNAIALPSFRSFFKKKKKIHVCQ